jgi:subtilisin family serine protease
VCEGNRKNVLVVAATGLDGSGLIEKTITPPAPGSNWNEQLVHIAAPGMGYYAPGRDNTYVPVRGTSFATPLVTATAALLFSQGVQDPWLIKQRIIATADERDNLLHKVYGAGLLNVRRAVTWPKYAVLGTGATAKVVDLEPGDITIRWQAGAGGSRTFPLSHVRRLSRNQGGQSYRIIYLDDITDVLVVQDEVNFGPWPFSYHLVDTTTGQPVGNVIPDGLDQYTDYVGPITF